MTNLSFSIQTMQTMNGGSLKALTPDKDGFYNNIPLMVIGKPSRNKVLYEPSSVQASMADPKSNFYKNLAEGNLKGEWGHPLPMSTKEATIIRTLRIYEPNVSHYFRRIYTDRVGEYTIIYGDVKPCGPMGKYLTESFQDPNRNTSFSIRTLCSAPRMLPGGIQQKSIVAMSTIDAVSGPGFEEASKRYAVGYESFTKDIATFTTKDLFESSAMLDGLGFEAIHCQEILDRLESDKVTIATQTTQIDGYFDAHNNNIVTDAGNKSILHSLL